MPRKPRTPAVYWAPLGPLGKPVEAGGLIGGGFFQTAQLHVRITPALYKALKVRAAETGVTLQHLVETALRKPLGLPARPLAARKAVRP
jgi:hypothetical protein